MSTIHLHQTTTLTPEQYIAGLTDFGPGRSKLFGNSADEYMKVHDLRPTQADVTEGSGGIWERLHYDWSDPNHVVLKTTDSNTWGGASGHTYNFTRRPNGTTDIDVVVLDLAMPDMDGIEAATLMSSSDSAIPIILFTILEIEGIERTATRAGIRAIVPKSNAWGLIPEIEKVAHLPSSAP